MPSDGHEEIVRIAEMFGDIARSLAASHEDLRATLDNVVRLAVEHLDGCEFAGMWLVEGGDITSSVSSGDLPDIVDAIQSEVDEGPCLGAIKEHRVLQTGDLETEERWPQFSTRAYAETGIRSILSFPLFVEEDTMGALNLYSTDRDAFDDTDVALAAVFAAHAAVAMSAARREEQLERKAESRDVIGRAKGILMARSSVDDDEAFDMLRRASQRLNMKLVDVAEQVVQRAEPKDTSAP